MGGHRENLGGMSTSVQVVWFKKDLRVHDHPALSSAAERGLVLPLYIYEPEQLTHEEFAGHHLTYLNECLRDLGGSLAALGAPLVIRRGEAVDVLEVLRRDGGPLAGRPEQVGGDLAGGPSQFDQRNHVGMRQDLVGEPARRA